MILVNIMISLSALFFYILLDNYNTIGSPVSIIISVLIFLFISGAQFFKVQMLRKGQDSFVGHLIGTLVVFFILGLSVKPFIDLAKTFEAVSGYLFLGWLIALALFLIYVPFSTISKLDKKIADVIGEKINTTED